MPLRTYPLITHPAFLRYVEDHDARLKSLDYVAPDEIPSHRPKLANIYEISNFLRVSHAILRSMLRSKQKHYRTFEIQKRSGGVRTISAPRTFLKVVQWWISDTILANTEVPNYVYGFVKGRSFIDNAKRHLGARHILNVDIENFFPSIRAFSVYEVFQSLGYIDGVAIPLTELVTLDEGLPQGAPTSPGLSNLIFREADREIREKSVGYGIEYTRYADDLTFSSSERISLEFLSEIIDVLSKHRFRLNQAKTHFMGPNQRKEVTGLVLGRDGVAFSARYLNGTRGWLHRIKTDPVAFLSQGERVAGTLALIRAVGGRGSEPIIKLGTEALTRLEIARRMRLIDVII